MKRLAKHFRHLFRTLVSDEPLWQLIHQRIVTVLKELTSQSMKNSSVISKISYYSPILGNFLQYAVNQDLALPNFFFQFLKELADISYSFVYFFLPVSVMCFCATAYVATIERTFFFEYFFFIISSQGFRYKLYSSLGI